jgi:hypothetical protein
MADHEHILPAQVVVALELHHIQIEIEEEHRIEYGLHPRRPLHLVHTRSTGRVERTVNGARVVHVSRRGRHALLCGMHLVLRVQTKELKESSQVK